MPSPFPPSVSIPNALCTTVSGNGYYYLSGGTYTSGTITIANGGFTLPITLGYGYNYLTLYDANWNYYSVTIYTTGGLGAPVKVVAITSPIQNDKVTVSGTVVVTGTIALKAYTPVYVYGYVYDYATYTYTYLSNQATDIASGRYQDVGYDATTGAFAFKVPVTAGNTTYIQVYAYDAAWLSHGHTIYVNNAGYTDSFWKPGAKATVGSAAAQAHQTEFRKQTMSRKPR